MPSCRCLFIENAGLRHLAGIPSARAIVRLAPAGAGGGAGRSRLHSQQRGTSLHRGRQPAGRQQLEIVRGRRGARAGRDDLVMIEAPRWRRSATSRLTLQRRIRLGHRGDAHPTGFSRSTSSIVAIAAGPNDQSRRRLRSSARRAKNSSSSKSPRAPAPPSMSSAVAAGQAWVPSTHPRHHLLAQPAWLCRLCWD